MRGMGISTVLMGAAVVMMTATMAHGQDPADMTPSAPAARPAGGPGGAAGAQGGRPGRGGAGAQLPLPQMTGNGGDSNRDGIIESAKAALDALKAGNLEAYGASMTDDGLYVDASGILRKPEVLKSLAGVKVTDYTMSDLRFVPDSADNGVISYTLTETGTKDGKPFTAKKYVSSAWEGGGAGGGGFGRRFVCVFSQETPAK